MDGEDAARAAQQQVLLDIRDLLYALVLFQTAQHPQQIQSYGPDVDALLSNIRARLKQ